MVLEEGIYQVLCQGGERILSIIPPASKGFPILCVRKGRQEPTLLRVEPCGNNIYVLSPEHEPRMPGSLVIGDGYSYMPKLVPSGSDEANTNWAILPSGQDTYRIYLDWGDSMNWTAKDDGPIVLQDYEGKPTQEWIFKKVGGN
ncbi:hypothetical protein RSAG8_10188, partial [Rhizoctonia solani AG-8 WAC10335]